MSMDGFSLSNVGISKDVTSAQATAAAEQLAQKGSDGKVETINKALNKRITDEDKGKNQKHKFFHDGFADEEENEDEEKESLFEEEPKSKRKGLDRKNRNSLKLKNAEELAIRFNKSTETVELFNTTNNRIVETIAAEDLVSIISKLDFASGILLNKEV